MEDGRALGTLQIGQPAWIAERTGATIVADVRSRDVAAGGHGAPLASLVDVLLLSRHPDHVRGSLNLGGISNITVVSPTKSPIAFDIGSANALMDSAATWLHERRGELRPRRRALGAWSGDEGFPQGTVERPVLPPSRSQVDG